MDKNLVTQTTSDLDCIINNLLHSLQQQCALQRDALARTMFDKNWIPTKLSKLMMKIFDLTKLQYNFWVVGGGGGSKVGR